MFNSKQLHINKTANRIIFFMLFLFTALAASAQQTTNKSEQSIWINPVALTLLALILILLLVIAILANLLLGIAKLHADKQNNTSTAAKTIAVMLALFVPAISEAQQAATSPSTSIAGLSTTTFYLFIAVLAIELLVILLMSYFVKRFLAKEKVIAPVEITAERKPSFSKTWWEKINSFKPADQEASIDMGHDYDGIRELNNRLPPWWIYGFYLTIFVSIVYLWRYHISETAPLSKQEFEISMKHAEEEKAAYLAKSANKVDENTVQLIKDASALSIGKNAFEQMCSACHGKEGQGGVGPNLTDAYWVSGGSIKDIFKTIKYGRPEKGMKSWNDDYSPIQIAQLASYIKTLQGTNPPNQKEKQGELYKEDGPTPAKDSVTTKEIIKSSS